MDRAYCGCRKHILIEKFIQHIWRRKKNNPSAFAKHKDETSTQNAQNQQITVKFEAMPGKAVLQYLPFLIAFPKASTTDDYWRWTFQLYQLMMVLIFLEISDGSYILIF